MCERELETERNCNILIPTLLAISVSFPFSWAAQPGAWGPASLGAGFLYRILPPTRLIPNSQSAAWGLPLLGAGFLCRILSPTHLISKLINWGPEGSLCWVLAFSTASCLQLVWSPNCKYSIGGLRAPSAGCWLPLQHLTPTGLVSKLPDFLSSLCYIIVQRPPSSGGRHNFALIQPVHGQGYNILIIPRPDAPVIYTGAFPILTAQPGRRSIYNRGCGNLACTASAAAGW